MVTREDSYYNYIIYIYKKGEKYIIITTIKTMNELKTLYERKKEQEKSMHVAFGTCVVTLLIIHK